MRIKCSYCDAGEPVVFCSADDALFCLPCDEKIHVNTPFSQHKRVLLSFTSHSARPRCDNCPGEPGHFLCLQDRSLLCRDCDLSLHKPNSVSAAHLRVVVMGANIREIDVRVNRGKSSSQSTVCSSVPPAGYQYGMVGTSSSASTTVSAPIPPAGFQYSMASRAMEPAAKGGKTASKNAGKRILGWDKTSPSVSTLNPVQYQPVPNKRCAGMHSLHPQPQWTGSSTPMPTNPNHVYPSSSPMPSMSLVLKPSYIPTPRFSPSDPSHIATTSHNNPPIPQTSFYGQSNEIPANSYPSNQQYFNQNPFNQQSGDDFFDPLGLSNMDISSLLDDDCGLQKADCTVNDNSDWWRYLQATEEFLNSEIEADNVDRSASRQFQQVMESTRPSSSSQPPPLDSLKGKKSSLPASFQYNSFPSTSTPFRRA